MRPFFWYFLYVQKVHNKTKSMKYKHIVFDIDGTLIDTERAALESLSDTIFELTGERREPESLWFAFGPPAHITIERVGLDMEAGLRMWYEKFGEAFKDRVEIYAGVREVLERLTAEGCSLGVVTSKVREEYEAKLSPRNSLLFAISSLTMLLARLTELTALP